MADPGGGVCQVCHVLEYTDNWLECVLGHKSHGEEGALWYFQRLMCGAVKREEPWIPPTGLAIGQVSHGLSWVVLIALSIQGTGWRSFTISDLAWVHLVALGWLTTVALSVLLFVIPNSCEEPIRGQRLARLAIGAFAVGTYSLVTGFWTGSFGVVFAGACIIVAALACYLMPVGSTLIRTIARQRRTERSVARATSIVLLALAAAVALGLSMAWDLVHGALTVFLATAPAIHAHLAGVAWLTLLALGVSVRTLRPITGAPPPSRLSHIIASMSSVAGLLLLVVGLSFDVGTITDIGAAVLIVAVSLYAIDLGRAVVHATVAHRPPQAFLAAAAVWLVVSAALGAGALLGQAWQDAYVFVALIGWLGQMVNGHLYHIGVRLLATMVRGDDDETHPGSVLPVSLSWASWALFQAATAGGAIALLVNQTKMLTIAGIIGLLGWLLMATNVGIALRKLAPTADTLAQHGTRRG